MSKTKVWIIGAQGRLGSTISDALDRMAYNVLTSDMDVDITDMDSVTAFMDMSHPAVVINCAGYNTHNWLEEDMVKASESMLLVREMLLLHPVKWAQNSFICQQMTYLTDRGMNH